MPKTETTFAIQISVLNSWMDVDGFTYSKHQEGFDVFERIKQRGIAAFDSHANAVRFIRRDEIVIDSINKE